MKVLVTGGSGFVGSHLIDQLVVLGHQVRAISRSESSSAYLRTLGAEPVPGDLDDGEGLLSACNGCEVLYHAAAKVEFNGTEAEFTQTTVDGTRRILEAAKAAGIRRFVQVSSCGVFHPDQLTSGTPLDETMKPLEPPDWFPYARAKLRAEELVQELCPPDVEWTIVRLGYLYGPRNRTMKAYIEPVMHDSIMMIVGDGQNELALVYAEDAARAILLAGLKAEAAGQILIAGPSQHITQQQYFDAMADGFGIPHVKKRIPYNVAMFWAWVGEKVIKAGPKAAAARRSAIALNGLPQRFNCERTQKLLGWRAMMDFEEGMKRTFEWYHKEYGTPSA
jgi:nucleoside-diphosphate-sugar epimerase